MFRFTFLLTKCTKANVLITEKIQFTSLEQTYKFSAFLKLFLHFKCFIKMLLKKPNYNPSKRLSTIVDVYNSTNQKTLKELVQFSVNGHTIQIF